MVDTKLAGVTISCGVGVRDESASVLAAVCELVRSTVRRQPSTGQAAEVRDLHTAVVIP